MNDGRNMQPFIHSKHCKYCATDTRIVPTLGERCLSHPPEIHQNQVSNRRVIFNDQNFRHFYSGLVFIAVLKMSGSLGHNQLSRFTFRFLHFRNKGFCALPAEKGQLFPMPKYENPFILGELIGKNFRIKFSAFVDCVFHLFINPHDIKSIFRSHRLDGYKGKSNCLFGIDDLEILKNHRHGFAEFIAKHFALFREKIPVSLLP